MNREFEQDTDQPSCAQRDGFGLSATLRAHHLIAISREFMLHARWLIEKRVSVDDQQSAAKITRASPLVIYTLTTGVIADMISAK